MKALPRCLLLAAAIAILCGTAAVPQTERPVSKAVTLTLIAGEDTADLDGEPCALQAKPYRENGAFYLPMEQTVTLLGGCYRETAQTVETVFPTCTAEYTLGEPCYRVNGQTITVDRLIWQFSEDGQRIVQEKAADQTPLRNHGIVYFPLGFTGTDVPDRYETGLSSVVYADGTSVIFSTVQEEDCLINTASTDSTITAGMPFAALPEQIRSELQKCDDVGTVLNYAIDHYRSDDLDISVMRLLSGEDEENMADKICRAAARTARFRTPRGLRVGDGEAKIELLYGRQDDPFLRFCVENDRVSEIIVRKNYC